MTNAAFRLATRLRGFACPSNEQPQTVRGFSGPDDLQAWRRHTQDADLMRTVDSILQGMDASGTDVEMFIEALPRWYAGVHFATQPWGYVTPNQGMRAVCSEGDINLLQALGLVIKTGGALHLTEEDRRTLADVLAEARDLVENDTTDMPADVRHYLWSLILRAEMVVNNLNDYGAEAVRQVAFELGGAMTAQAERAEAQQEPARASRWKAAATHLMAGFFGAAGTGAAGQLGHVVEEVVKQIGS